MNSMLSNMKAYREICYNFNEFFILFSLIPLSVSSSFFSQTPISSLIFSHPLIFSSSPSVPFHAHTHTESVADANANTDASIPRQRQRQRITSTPVSLQLWFLFFFFFFFFSFFGCGFMGGLGNGWLRMDRSVVGGFGWADRRPPRSTTHLTLSDQIALFFFFFLVDVG